MIKSIEIFNFRTHEHSLLEFDEGVNVITGDNRSGKTNVLRALNWVVYNRPSGESFHSRFVGEDLTKVVVKTPEDIITIQRSKKKTMYVLNGQKFKAVGRAVPEPVQKALNLTEINISDQLADPYLITSPSSQISKAINQVTELDKADTWVAKLTNSINQGNRTVKALEVRGERNKNKLDKFRGLDKVGVLIEKEEKVEGDFNEKREAWEEFKYWKDEVNALEGVGEIGGLIDKLQECEGDRKDAEEGIEILGKFIAADKRVKRAAKAAGVGGVIKKYDEVRKEVRELFMKWKKVKRVNDRAQIADDVADEAELARQLYMKGLKESGKCPLCMSDITEEVLERLEGEL